MIGDGVNDMQAGKAVGAFCIGIAHSAPHVKLLRENGADVAFDVITDGWDAVVDFIKGLLWFFVFILFL